MLVRKVVTFWAVLVLMASCGAGENSQNNNSQLGNSKTGNSVDGTGNAQNSTDGNSLLDEDSLEDGAGDGNSDSASNLTSSATGPQLPSDKALLSFGLSANAAPVTSRSLRLDINYDVDITRLVPHFTFKGKAVFAGNLALESGVTPVDFTTPLTLSVQAEDGSRTAYTVTIRQQENPKILLNFSLKEFPQRGTVDLGSNTITLVLPYRSAVNRVTPVFSTTGNRVSVGGTTLVSSRTTINLSEPEVLIVSDDKGRSRSYKLNVSVTPANGEVRLKTLRIEGFNLVPPFDPDVGSYTIRVPAQLEKLSLLASPAFPHAALQLQINDSPAQPMAANVLVADRAIRAGDNNFFLRVMAEDEKTTKYYIIAIRRQ